MVGVRTWPMTEIIWILEKWRDKWKLQDLVDQYGLEFPNSNRNGNRKTLRTGIQYVWDKYNKDPSYNHDFSQEEIWFIMVNSHRVEGSIIKEVLALFKREFPDHDWKVYVDELLAIEAAIAKYQRQLPYCIQWQHNEIRFVLVNKLKMKSWEKLLKAFQVWREREEVTITGLQYLHASRHLDRYHKIEIMEEFDKHYLQYLNGFRWTFAKLNFSELENLEWKMTPYNYNDSPATAQNSSKRRREVGSVAVEIQSKRLRMCPQQNLGGKERANQSALDVNDMRASTHHSNQMGKTRFLGRYRPQIPLIDSRADPHVHFSGPGVRRQHARGEGHWYPSQPMHATNFNKFTSTTHVWQRNSPSPSPSQVLGPRYPFSNSTPQQNVYDGWDRPYLITPVQNALVGNEQIPRNHHARTLSRGATSPPNTGSDWSPRDSWNQNHFQPSNHYTAPVSAYASSSTLTNWQGPLDTSPNDLWGIPGIGESHLGYAHMEDPSMEAGLTHVETMQELVPAMPDPLGILVAGENEKLLNEINVLRGHAEFQQLGDLPEPAPATFSDLSVMQGRGEIQKYHSDMDASTWHVDLHSCEKWLAPISTIHDDISYMLGTGEAQESYPDRHALVGQAAFHSYENPLIPTSTITGDFPDTFGMEGNQMHLPDLNIIPEQPAFISNGNWPEPPSMVSGDLPCTLGMEEYQSDLFFGMDAAEMQCMHLQNGNLQDQQLPPVNPQKSSILPVTENNQAAQPTPAASSGAGTDADELWRKAVATEPGGYEDFFFTDPVDLTTLDGLEEGESTASSNPLDVLGVGDPQVFKCDEDTFPERVDFSTSEAFHQPETTSAIKELSFLGMEMYQVSDRNQETSSEPPIVTKTGHFEDVQLTRTSDISSLFGSDEGEWIDPAWESFSGVRHPTTEYEVPGGLTDIGAVAENQMQAKEVQQRQPAAGNDGSHGEVHENT